MDVETVTPETRFETGTESTGFSEVLTPKIPVEKKEKESGGWQQDYYASQVRDAILDAYRQDFQRNEKQHQTIKGILLDQARREGAAIQQEQLSGQYGGGNTPAANRGASNPGKKS
jgi:hypothetical protein